MTTAAVRGRTSVLLFIGAIVFLSPMAFAEAGSDYAERLQEAVPNETYPDAAAPANPIFRHDFSKEHTLIYDYWQRDKAQSDTGRFGSMATQTMLNGNVVLESLGNGTGNIIIQDVKAAVQMGGMAAKGGAPKQMALPDSRIAGIQEDGTTGKNQVRQNMTLELLFPLPSKPLKVGETDSITSDMEMNVSGAVLSLESNVDITLKRYAAIGDRVCAELDVHIVDISEKEPTKDSDKAHFAAKGRGLFYFDMAKRQFIFGAAAVDMSFGVKAGLIKVAGDNASLIRVNLKD